jgi:hypothetical protein
MFDPATKKQNKIYQWPPTLQTFDPKSGLHHGPFELKLSTTKGGDCNHSGQVFNPVPPMPNMYIKYYKYVIYLIYIYTYVHIYIYPEETLEVI